MKMSLTEYISYKDNRPTKTNGDVLLYNDTNPNNRSIYEAAKAETNMDENEGTDCATWEVRT